MSEVGGEQAPAREALDSLAPVLSLSLDASELHSDDVRVIRDLLEATAVLHAYVEYFDPLSGAYRIVLLGQFGG